MSGGHPGQESRDRQLGGREESQHAADEPEGAVGAESRRKRPPTRPSTPTDMAVLPNSEAAVTPPAWSGGQFLPPPGEHQPGTDVGDAEQEDRDDHGRQVDRDPSQRQEHGARDPTQDPARPRPRCLLTA